MAVVVTAVVIVVNGAITLAVSYGASTVRTLFWREYTTK
jgi:hypothetical protein